ncbi:hypothetical protein WJX73_001894 [Symbiochloris irregularis]|uniref:CHCH domain-containing protein n=1 Tax=Symbiochloris irregularis TaxID=706552 RepID=A0AAW1P5K2_9CHLO
MAISKHIAIKCGKQNKAFADCKLRDQNPSACLGEGEKVTRCVVDLLKDLNSKYPSELRAYFECMDYYSNNFEKCRKEQKAFEEKSFSKA